MKWTQTDKKKLKQYISQKLTTAEIAVKMNRTYMSIKKKADYLSLVPVTKQVHRPKKYTVTQKYNNKVKEYNEKIRKCFENKSVIERLGKGKG